ncbi:hypothetical protein D3C71_530710 [compost metagenome]
MNQIQLLLLCIACSCSAVFSQEEERNAHLVLKIHNEKGEVFKGSILLIANNDTIPLTASWNNFYRTDFLPGNYRVILKNKLFNDYIIDSLWIGYNETKELEITWGHRTIRLPEIRFPLCGIY